MKYAIIGCVLMGRRRLAGFPVGSQLVVACDTDLARDEDLVRLAGTGRATTDFKLAAADPQVDAVIVATVNSALAEVSGSAIRAGKHVLVEKPAAVSVREIDGLLALAERHGVCVRVGYDREWRADPKLSGGGQSLDQGVHLIDLAGWFLGPFSEVAGRATTFFWDMPVDDNAFLQLETAAGQSAWLHVSSTEWKNLFSFEVYGRRGKLHVEGLGGSYGVERLQHHRVKPEMGRPDTTLHEFSGPDQSWDLELTAFEPDIRRQRVSDSGLPEARAALQIVERIYRESGFDLDRAPPRRSGA